MYIGYHLWDIPKDFNLALGEKYTYAVSGTLSKRQYKQADHLIDRTAI